MSTWESSNSDSLEINGLEEDNQCFEVDFSRGEEGVFLLQESKDEELKRLVTLEMESKA